MRVRRALLVTAGVAIVLFAALLVAGARVPRAALVAATERALGRRLTIGAVRLRVVPRPAVDVLEVRAEDAGTIAGCAAALEAERIRLRLAIGPLLLGRAVVERVDVEAPFLRLVRPVATPGERRRPERGRGPDARDRATRVPAPVPAAERPAADRHVAFRVREVRVRRGRVQLLDDATATRWALARIAATVKPGEGARRAAVDVQGVLRRETRAALAPVRVRGEMRLDGDAPRFRGRVRAGSFSAGALWIDGAEARMQAGTGGVRLRNLVVRLGEGAVAGRGRLVLGGAPAFALSVAGQGESLEETFEDTADVVLDGRWRARLALQGPAPWRAGARRALRGAGRISVRDGAVTPFPLGAAVLDVVVPLRGREQTQQLRSRYPELFGGRLRFTRLAGTLRVSQSRVRTRDLAIRGIDYRADVRGGMGFDGSLAGGADLHASPRLTEDLLGRGALALVLGASPGVGLVVPLRVEGTIERPRIRATSEWSRALIRRTLGDGAMGDLLERLVR